MMSLPEPMPSLTSHLARLAQRFGVRTKALHQILERASRLQLPFARLPEPEPSIFWNDGPCLQRLLELPRGALSGPVQEDKARAHAALTRLIRKESDPHCEIDLRQIDGIGGCASDGVGYLPGFDKGTPIELRQASWLGERLYWTGEHHIEAFACAIAYARLRGLEVMLPAEITDYRLDRAGLQALDAGYHAVTMPAQAWNDRDFMALLLDTQVPYARLTLLRNASNSELLLLEKRDPTANAIGEGLKLAGAPDMLRYLRDLPQITRFKRGQPAPS